MWKFFDRKKSLVTGTNSSIWFELLIPISNLELKQMVSYLNPVQGVHHGYPLWMLLHIISAKVLSIFIDADTRIKGAMKKKFIPPRDIN